MKGRGHKGEKGSSKRIGVRTLRQHWNSGQRFVKKSVSIEAHLGPHIIRRLPGFRGNFSAYITHLIEDDKRRRFLTA